MQSKHAPKRELALLAYSGGGVLQRLLEGGMVRGGEQNAAARGVQQTTETAAGEDLHRRKGAKADGQTKTSTRLR